MSTDKILVPASIFQVPATMPQQSEPNDDPFDSTPPLEDISDDGDEEELDSDGYTVGDRMELAIDAILAAGFKDNGLPKLSYSEAVRRFNLPSRTTLQARMQGRQKRAEASKARRLLPDGAEEVLKEWIREKGRRGMPMSPEMVAEHVKVMWNMEVGKNWVLRFRARNPDLKAKWTTSLEQCRAQALNEVAVDHYFQMLKDTIDEFNISPENIYNMDEKGIQLGAGKRIMAIVDRDQKTVQHVEDGNRELVTIIECVCADGTAIRPSLVYKGAKRDLEWGRKNPCNARRVL